MGHGARLFQFVADYALNNKFDFLNWIVEANNDVANAIYRKMGAQISDGWSYVRIDKTSLGTLAAHKLRGPASGPT